MEQLEALSEKISAGLENLHRSYTRKEIHPLLLCSPFIHRTYTKPLGYAGDYEMINMILSDTHKGESLFAKTINALILEADPAIAHRNRIQILTRLLQEEAQKCHGQGKRLKILNVACGPAKETREFIQDAPEEADVCDMTFLDLSPEALEFAERETRQVIADTHSRMNLQIIQKSADQLLRESIAPGQGDSVVPEKYDYVYCAGLFDYLTDTVCQRLLTLFYEWTLPQGR